MSSLSKYKNKSVHNIIIPSSRKMTDEEYRISDGLARFRSLVRRVRWKLHGDDIKRIKNSTLGSEQVLQGFQDEINPTCAYTWNKLCCTLAESQRLRYKY